MRDYKTAVFIGRFQPFHNSHLEIVQQGLEIADNVIVVIGSARSSVSFKNPFIYDERKAMIQDTLYDADASGRRAFVVGVRDHYYNMEAWIASVQAVVSEFTNPGDSVALLGAFKDASSYYLRSFPQWDHIAALPGNIHATAIRTKLYANATTNLPAKAKRVLVDWEGKLSNPPDTAWVYDAVPKAVGDLVTAWTRTPGFAACADAWRFTEAYRASWDTAPFPPTFVTTDAVVVCSGHVLVVKRGFNPGKGLFALPGGFLKEKEFVEAGALRELKEETGIRVDKRILQSSIVAKEVFDHPDRDPRGRTITHAFYIKLPDGDLPEVKGNDDAEHAQWISLWDVSQKEDQFYGDHAHIINHFVGA